VRRSTRERPRGPLAPGRRSAFTRALERLALRDHSEEELRRALSRAGYPRDEIETTLDRLKDRRFVDDDSYALRFAQSRIERRGLGRHRVRQALHRRGVDRATIERGLEAALREVSESDALDEVARRYWRSHERDEPRRRMRKLCDHLVRRGFPGGLIRERLRALWPSWSEMLEGAEPEELEETDV